jgi:putative acetyltransferase
MDVPTYRKAVVEDADAICSVFRRSILELSKEAYSDCEREAWSRHAEPESFHSSIYAGRVMVAVVGGAIVGFSVFAPETGELASLYVAPGVAGHGIGAALLELVIENARAHKLDKVTLNASRNAKPFYEKHGFVEVSELEYELRGGTLMTCVRMERVL